MLHRPENVRHVIFCIGMATAASLAWAGFMGAPVWFLATLAVVWVAIVASGRTDRPTLWLLCLPLCWGWGVAWMTWFVGESGCPIGEQIEGQHWWPPYVDCQGQGVGPDPVEVDIWVFLGPFITGIVAAGFLVARGNHAWRLAGAGLASIVGLVVPFL